MMHVCVGVCSPSLPHSLPPSLPLSVIPWALESWAEYDIRVFADPKVLTQYANNEHALVVLNHRGDLDWMIGWVFIERCGMLGVSDKM